MVICVTHRKIDLEAASCLWFLQKRGLIDDYVFGEDSWRTLEGKTSMLIFVDCHPEEDISDLDVEVYDHHFIEKIFQGREMIELTSFDLLISSKGIGDLDEEKLTNWARVVFLSDYRVDTGDMDLKRALSRITQYSEMTDGEVYEEWFMPLVDSFFQNEKNVERGQKILSDAISSFLERYPETPARKNLEAWLEKLRAPEKLDGKRNILHFLSYMEEAEARKWLSPVFDSLHKEQSVFREVLGNLEERFEKEVKVDFGGRFLILSYITSKRAFQNALRYLLSNRAPFLPYIIKEYFAQLPKPYIVLQVNPENLNFQILTGGVWEKQDGKSIAYVKSQLSEIARELVKALRGEILVKRGIKMDDWREEVIVNIGKEIELLDIFADMIENQKPKIADELKEVAMKLRASLKNIGIKWMLSLPCDVVGTRPLFYNKKEFPQILWGSATHEAPPADIFGKDAEEIRRNLVENIKLVIDKEDFPPYCDPGNCLGCPMEFWYLDKCENKKRGNG
ncbi:hypothetical protein H5T87_02695 [bacterium]|nr:hypothetical protein [bacterium]